VATEKAVLTDVKVKAQPKPADEKIKKAPAKRAALAVELAAEVQGLRPVLRDIIEIYKSRVDGQLAGLCEVFQEAGGAENGLPPAKIEARMIEAVRALKVKARKGRVKDLARIEELASALWALMPQGG